MRANDRSSQPYAHASVGAAAFGLILMVGAIAASSHGFQTFFSLGGLVIVVGGVISSAFMSFDSNDVYAALNAIPQVLRQPHPREHNLPHDLADIGAWAHLIHERGARALEISLRKDPVEDPFIRYGLNMVVSNHTPDDVRTMMRTASDANYDRQSIPVDVLHTMASHAPAFGMVGTLVGMVGMLYNLTGDVGTIGSTLAVAFLSTLYGVVSARMVYLPAASRLRQDVEAVQLRYHLIAEGMALLAAGRSSMYIQDRLSGFLAPDMRDYFDVMAPPAIAHDGAEIRRIGHDTATRLALAHLKVVGS